MGDEVIEIVARAIYFAMYAKDGGQWQAVETKDVWHDKAQAALSALAAKGYVVVPVEPTEAMWRGLARDLMMWLDMNQPRPTGQSLYKHFAMLGIKAPDWLKEEIPDIDHVPSKGNRVVAIYRAMLSASQPPS